MKSKATIICQTLSRSITETGRIGQHHIYIEIDEFGAFMDVNLHMRVLEKYRLHVVAQLDERKDADRLQSKSWF